MSQTKVQLIAPIGVVTASTLETTGVLTATTFVGDIAGTVTGITSTTDNLNLGIITATSFAGDFTGIGSGLTGTPNVVAGVATATKFVGNTPGTVSGIADGTNINAGIITATSFVGNITGNAAGLSTTTAHVNLGIVTATSFHGSGANLSGVSAGPVAQQAVTADGATTTIDLSDGNVIYMTQSANTTVSFANTEGNTDVVYLVREKDASTTARTITWPSGLVWNGGTEPTLNTTNYTNEAQVFKLITRDNGATWYGVEQYNNTGGNELWGVGDNEKGTLGLNNTTHYSSPVQIPGVTWDKVEKLRGATAGAKKTAALKSDGTLWAWGASDAGSLGQNQNGDNASYSSPVQIPGTTWKNGMLTNSAIMTKTDGTLWAWGSNSYGNLAQNDRTQYSSPAQIPGTTWSLAIGSTRDGMGAGIKTDGTLWTWGRNGKGSLGHNDLTQRSSPVQVPGTTWSTAINTFSISYESVSAIKTDGTLWSWGSGWYGGLGVLGHADGDRRSSPVQVGSDTTWSKVICGNWNVRLATKTDGTLWAWGRNTTGQLGQNNTTDYSSPVQIPGTSWSSIISASGNAAAAMKTDGTAWVWGNNIYGKLGQNQAPAQLLRVSSPVQIPGTWTSLQMYGENNLLLTKS